MEQILKEAGFLEDSCKSYTQNNWEKDYWFYKAITKINDFTKD